MNKTLLLIICDFLLLNLLALTRWEKAEPTRPQPPPAAVVANGPNATTKDQDLVDVMKLSLEDAETQRSQLMQRLQNTESTLQSREQTLNQLQSERSQLAASLNETQRSAADLAQKVEAASHDAAISHERLTQLQRDLEQRQGEAARQREQLAQLEKEQASSRERIESLNVQVKVAEQEKQMLRETADTLKTQVQAERQERLKVQETTTQLAQGVGHLAEQSTELTKEIRDNRPINANVLFADYMANRVKTNFLASRDSLFGRVNRTKDTTTLLVTDGKQTYALMHVDDTPFAIRDQGPDWEKITATFSKDTYSTGAAEIEFLSVDPRVVAIPLDSTQAKGLNSKIYQTALDPYKFTDAVLISSGGAGYGEVAFKVDPTSPGYVRMDNRLMKRLFGDFAPSRGDLVLSKTGELLGIMVNSDFCAVINNFLPTRTLKIGERIQNQHTGEFFENLAARITRMPLRLQ